ncbi:MAG: single-stranded-DNA-specific exonuclease RecJ [Phycisphaerales bacterium]|nr:single-stranded-DNA-specific exonuclease RecJ [Phycisphaerales bacterium]
MDRAPIPLIHRVLAARGIGNGSAAAFLEPSLSQLHDPSLMPDLDRAAARLLDGVKRGERIAIYGDYDVDGVTATAILYHTLKAIAPGAELVPYVPHRLDEGYGLSEAAVRELAGGDGGTPGCTLIVSVDCGVTAVGPALAARACGVDLIITDHHTPPELESGLPQAYAVVHPRRPISAGTTEYPFGELCGAGVAYKLAWRLCTMFCGSARVSQPLRELLLDLLAFAALGVIADVVPLVGENRVMARAGLAAIKHSKFVGLRALVEASGLGGEKIDAADVGFKLGPRLNACGRMGHAREAVELFTTAGEERATEIARNLCGLNDERRRVEKEIFDQALDAAESAGMAGTDRRAIVLADGRWHQGVVGIVCSRLTQRLHRPAILLQRRDGLCHGSGRSVEGVDLHAALRECGFHLERFGGHAMAAGMQVSDAKLPAFTEAFIAAINSRLAPENLCSTIEADCEARSSELSVPLVQELARLGPFGRSNPSVSVLVRGLTLAGRPEPLGAAGKHLALRVRDNGHWMRLVAWGWGEHRERLHAGMKLDAILAPRLTDFNGVRVEPEVLDLCEV